MESIEQPKTGVGSTAETNRLLEGQFFNETTGAQEKEFTPGSIPADGLTSTSKPVKVQPPTDTTEATSLSELAKATAEQTKLAQEQEAKAQEAQAAVSTEKQSLADTFKSIIGLQQARPEMEKAAGIDIKAQRVTNVTNQIEASQRAQTNELRALEGLGLTDTQRSARAREINRKYAFEQADLALIQSAANRDLETASNILDRKIQFQLEPLKTQLDLTKFFYEENKESLTKAEQRAFELKTKELDRQFKREEESLNAVRALNLKLVDKGVTPSSSMLNATSQEDWLKAATKDKVSFVTGEKQGIITNNGKPLTDGQATSLGYARRLAQADQVINQIGSQFTSIGSIGGLLPSSLQSAERQQFEQAKRNFINAVLRKESGAAISPSEFSSAEKQYFPQPGDKEEVLEQKKQNRRLVIENFAVSANVPIGEVVTTTEDPLGLGLEESSNPLGI